MNPTNDNFSKNLRELREIAILLTGDRKIKVKYIAKPETIKNAPNTSFFNPEANEITLTLAPYPEFVKNNAVLSQRVLDGTTTHESGHKKITVPIWEYLNDWVTKIKRNRGSVELAKIVANVVEDIRVDYFMGLRFRYDFGKRLKLRQLILKDSIENEFNTQPIKANPKNEASFILAILVDEGKYEADCSKLKKVLSKEAREDSEKALKILAEAKYHKLKIDIIRDYQQIYDLIAKHLDQSQEQQIKQFVLIVDGGNVKGECSPELQKQIEAQISQEQKEEAEKQAKELKKDLSKGNGAGEGTGEEIPAPEPNYERYQELVDKNKPEIARLLNKIKQNIKPIVRREILQSRGRIQANLQTRAYANSFRNTVKNIYLNTKTEFEKERVAIGFLFDFSGSVDREEANDITTILTEVFANYVSDDSYAIGCFGADYCKIKSFFELSENTKARVGNIQINSCGTEISPLLSSFLKQFNNIANDRRKILVIASDFCLSDDAQALDLIKFFALANIEIILIGFCNCDEVDTWANHIKGKIKRAKITEVSELPEKFLQVYLNVEK